MSQEPESIQKYPKLPTPKNIDELLEQLYQQYPKPSKDASQADKQKQFEAITQGILDAPFQTEEQKLELRNQIWERNHDYLIRTIATFIQKKDRMPSISQLATETGMSRQTIRKHLREFQESATYQDQLQQFRLLSTQVVTQLFRLSMQGDLKAARAYLSAVGGLPGVEPAVSSPATTNYIQINNNIKIDQLTFTLLPQEVQQQITELILQGLQMTLSKAEPDPS